MKINIIVAYCKNNGIGINNNLPWSIKSDMKKFKSLTIGDGNNCVVMGSNTWVSLNNKGLVGRDNLILSKSQIFDYTINNNIVKSFNSMELLISFLYLKKYSEIWIIGGTSIYNLFLTSDVIKINEINITYIDTEYTCDTFFPKLNENKFYFVSKKKHEVNNISNNKTKCIYDIIYKSY